jgi:hypothetical protein
MRSPGRLAATAICWLVCQLAALALAPFGLCCDHGHETAAAAAHACAGMASDHVCPLHRPARGATGHSHHAAGHGSHRGGDDMAAPAPPAGDAPAMSCVCRVSDAGLASILVGQSVLPPSFVLPFEPTSSDIASADPRAATYAAPMDPRPPRA